MSSEQNIRFLESFFDANLAGLALGGESRILERINDASLKIAQTLGNSGLILSAGNGGSMADAMHLAEELSGKYRNPRKALRAVALSDPSFLTCVGNDFGFDEVFARGCEALMQRQDCAVLYSTSGKSKNILRAAEQVRKLGGTVIAVVGRPNSELAKGSDITLEPSRDVPTEIAQLIHTMWTHMIIELVEKTLGVN